MMFEWNDARYFLAVHRHGSLSGAGRALRVNQSTVGRRIDAFEDALGTRLFFRTRDGYVLAPEGEVLLPRAERMESEAHAAIREVSGKESSPAGTVRLTAPDALGARFLTPILATFRRKHPEIDLELIADNRTLSLTKREADMAVRCVTRLKEPSLVARRLPALASGLYASPAYLAARGKPRFPEFSGHDFVGFEDSVGRTPEVVWLEQHAKSGRIVFKSNSTHAHVVAASHGVGLAMLPCYLADEPEHGLVRVMPEPVLALNMWLAVHRDLQHTARVRVCADFVAAAFAENTKKISGVTERRKKRSGTN